MKHDKNDLLRRQDCIETIEGITCSMSVCVNTDECHGMKRMQRQAVLEIANMPSVQPDHNADIGKKVSISDNHENDCISRQAAIDAMGKAKWAKERLMELPAVQPDHVADISKKVERTAEIAQNVQNEDLIQRKAAIDAVKGLPTWWADEGGYYGGAQPPMVALLDPEDAVSAIENLPSAQPATNCSEIPNGSDDTISRQVAIDLFPNDALEWDTKGGYIAPHLARRMIEELPSAQPERKTGRWMFGFNNQYLEKYYYCSNCGCRKYTEDEPSDYFCPHCGADMRGTEDG